MTIFSKLKSFFFLNSELFKSIDRLNHDIAIQKRTEDERQKRIWIYAESIGEFKIAVYAAEIINSIFLERNKYVQPPIFFISFKTFSTLSIAQNFNYSDCKILYFFQPFFPIKVLFKKYINYIKPDYFISVQHEVSKKFIKELLNFGRNSNLNLKLIFTGILASDFKKMKIQNNSNISGDVFLSSAIYFNSSKSKIDVKSEILPLSLKYISCMDVVRVNNAYNTYKNSNINLNKKENKNYEAKILSLVSIHKKESLYILKILKEIISEEKIFKCLRLKLIMAPRNIKIAGLLFKKASDAGFNPVYYGLSGLTDSKESAIECFLNSKDADVLIINRYGILNKIYPISDIVYVGKSLFKNESGGHNVLEPAAYGKAVVTGKCAFNFMDIIGEMSENKALILVDKKNFKESILKLIENDNLRIITGKKGLDFCLKKKDEFEEYFKKNLAYMLSENMTN